MTNRTRASNQQSKGSQNPADKTQEAFFGKSSGKKMKGYSKGKGKRSHNPHNSHSY